MVGATERTATESETRDRLREVMKAKENATPREGSNLITISCIEELRGKKEKGCAKPRAERYNEQNQEGVQLSKMLS